MISIIIVNYNGAQVLPECLRSLFQQDESDFEVILVDNASTDDSLNWVKNNYPRVRLHINEENLGFARACNQGYEMARGEYIALLNYDAIPAADWLVKLRRALDSAADVGACMPKILLQGTEPPRLNSSGGVLHFLGVGWAGDYDKPDNPDDKQVREIAFASGAAVLIKREVIAEVGLFDEKFFMYCEDSDFSWRIRLSGRRILYVPTAVVWHKYHFSKGRRKFYLIERNRLIMFLTNYNWRTIAWLAPPALLFEIGMLGYALAGGWFRLKTRSYGEIIKGRRYLSERRRRVRRLRRVSDKELAALFAAEIDFAAVNNVFISTINHFFRLYWKLAYRFIA